MTFNELQYWRARSERLEAANAALVSAAEKVIRQWDTPNWKLTEPTGSLISELRAALSDASPAMDEATARAWRESDGDHRNHVEDRK